MQLSSPTFRNRGSATSTMSILRSGSRLWGRRGSRRNTGAISGCGSARLSEETSRCFDGEDTSLDDAARRSLFKCAMEEHAIPLLKSSGTHEGIHRRLAKGSFREGFVHGQVFRNFQGTREQ